MNPYHFTLRLGDWSNDGHGRTETFRFSSNKSVEELRKIEKKALEIFNIYQLCSEYGQDFVTPGEIETLPEDLKEEYFNPEEMMDGCWYMEPLDLATFWLGLMSKADSELQVEIAPDSPSFGQGLGYGLF